jgi:hypothetical protein
MQGFQQGQEQQMTEDINRTNLETGRFKLDELKRDRAEMLQLQTQLKNMGQDPDLDKLMDVYARSGRPDYVKMGLEGKQKLKEQREFAKLVGGDMAAPEAAVAAPAAAPPVMRMPQAPAPTNALGSGTFGMGAPAPANALAAPAPAPAAAPVNALANPNAGQIQQTQKRINDLRQFAASNPGMAAQAMQQARLLQDQLELFSKRGPAESPDVQTMRALGIPITPEGYQTFTGAKRPDRLLTAEEEAQQLRLRLASRPPGVSITNVAEKAESGEFGKFLVGEFGDISKAANLAIKTMPAIETNLGILNKGFDTGFATETKAAGAKVLSALGVDNAEKFAANAEIFQAKAAETVLQKQLEQKGPQTQSDRELIQTTGAQLGTTTQGNRFLLTVAKEQLQRDIDQRDFYRKWRERTGSFNGAESAWYAGEGGKSLFDRPALKKYAPSAASGTSPAATNNRTAALDAIFNPKKK